MSLKLFAAALALTLLTVAGASAQRTPSPPGARVYIINLKQGAHVTSPFLVQFGLSGMGIAPAGVEAENTGHHHLLIDTGTPVAGTQLPMDENNRHFGKGQTEATITLPPGSHTLQLAFADASHFLHNPPVTSEKIFIVVDK
jgi:hypothetical protein